MTKPDSIPTRTDPVWRSVHRALERLGSTWELPGLLQHVEVVFSRRLTRRLGRAMPRTGRITLHVALATAPRALLREALCHEAAHVAVFRLYDENRRPHGPEWADLVRQAGYEPRKMMPLALSEISRKPPTYRRYEHLCPVCQEVRIARRPMTRWRCKVCVESGLSGALDIKRVGR